MKGWQPWAILAVFLGVVIILSKKAVDATGLSDRIRRLADAIAFAEGANVPGSVPNRLNNPGDLTLDLTGKAIGKQGIYVIYATYADGREALERQCELMLTGQSHVYIPSMTIVQMAMKYTTTEQGAWATNVAMSLGVSPLTTLAEI